MEHHTLIIIRKVLQSETSTLSEGNHRWFKRRSRERRPVTRNNKIIIITIILFDFLFSSTYLKMLRLLTPGFLQFTSLKLTLMNYIIYSTIFNPLNNVPSFSSSTFHFISFIPFSHFTIYSIKIYLDLYTQLFRRSFEDR